MISTLGTGDRILFFCSVNVRPGVYAEQGVHAQKQTEIASQFHRAGEQPDREIESPSLHVTEGRCFAQVDDQPRMFHNTFA